MEKENYTPRPLDTRGMELPQTLAPLVERMAENVHEVWARDRAAEGWRYGPRRDDLRKEHPCMVPYRLLPEQEKVYDRNTSVETLKFILLSGFKITE